MGADTEVLIVGAGPVGLTLAIDLGQKGVRCTLIERKEAPQFLPKMERCNARTMEIFRRMGLAGKIRAAGLDRNVPMDVYVILAMNEPPLLRLPYPSVAECVTSSASVCAARATSCSCARRCTPALISTSASRSATVPAKGAITMSPTIRRRS